MTSELSQMKEKFKLMSQSDFYNYIQDSPLSNIEKDLMLDIRKGLSNENLSEKYKKTISRITQWKHSIYEKLYNWDENKIELTDDITSKKIDLDEIISQKVSEQFKRYKKITSSNTKQDRNRLRGNHFDPLNFLLEPFHEEQKNQNPNYF